MSYTYTLQAWVVVGTDIVVVYNKKTLKYQTRLDKWEKCQDIPQNVHAPNSTVAVGHKMFVLDFPDFLAYDTVEDQWTKLAAPIRHCHSAAMVLKQGKLMVLGGYDASGITHPLIQTYDVHRQRWNLEEETMSVPLKNHSALLMVLPKTLTGEKSKSQTLTMNFLLKTFVKVIVSLGSISIMYFIFHSFMEISVD